MLLCKEIFFSFAQHKTILRKTNTNNSMDYFQIFSILSQPDGWGILIPSNLCGDNQLSVEILIIILTIFYILYLHS